MIRVTEDRILENLEYILIEFEHDDEWRQGAIARWVGSLFLLSDEYDYDGGHPSVVSSFSELDFEYGYAIGPANLIPSVAMDGLWGITDWAFSDFKVEETKVDYLAEGYEVKRKYRGFGGYHSHHGTYINLPIQQPYTYRVGVEMEVEFHTRSERDVFTSKRSNWFYCERDGSLGDSGCEIVTIPLLPKDVKSADFWSQLTESLIGNACATSSCGLHVHIGKDIFPESRRSESLGKLLYLYHHHLDDTTLNTAIFGREHGYHATSGKTVSGDAAKMFGRAALGIKEVQDKVARDLRMKSEGSRYYDINITNENTIEFRKGAGTTDPQKVISIVEYVELMCKYVLVTSWGRISYEDFYEFLKKRVRTNYNKIILQNL